MKRVAITQLEVARGTFRLGPLDLELASGSRTALVGPSGSGKTTLLRALAGLEPVRAGTIAFDQTPVSRPGMLLAPDRRRIGFVFQSGALWPHLDALRHLRFAAPQLHRDRARALLAEVGLGGKEHRRPGELSGGEQQRLALARALAGAPELLLLDEPLHSLDVHLRDELALLIRRVADARGLTLVVVTHDRAEALALADRVVVLRDGQVVEAGAILDVLRTPRTAWTASFLAQAACLLVDEAADPPRTAFGPIARPLGAEGRRALVLLPGDVVLAPDGSGPEALVRQVEPAPNGVILGVELDGRLLRVAAAEPVPAGTRVHLGLRSAPRVLPFSPETASPKREP
ncbi:MAG: ABC transporter ATP-binding protein [Planctomycetes bacterium]|nr:ABC transporter ATP-binding protein [Planctomycetota bacterium]